MTESLARAAGMDAANKRMKAGGRTAWSREDYDAGVAEFRRLWPDPHEGERFRLVNRADGQADQTPPKFIARRAISLAEARRRLPVGTEFIGEFIGINARICKPGMQTTRRQVVKNSSHELESILLDGPKKSQLIHLNWKHTSVEEENLSLIFTMTEVTPQEAFLKITIQPPIGAEKEAV